MNLPTYGDYFKEYLVACAETRLEIILKREEEIAVVYEQIDPDIFAFLYSDFLNMNAVEELPPDVIMETLNNVAYISWLVQDCNYHIICFNDIVNAISLF